MHSVGGPSHLYFYVFPWHPYQKRPWSCHSAFCGGSFRHLYFYVFPRHPLPEAALEPPLWILCGVLLRTMPTYEQLA